MTDDIGVGLYLEGVTERSRSSLKLCQSYRMPTGISRPFDEAFKT